MRSWTSRTRAAIGTATGGIAFLAMAMLAAVASFSGGGSSVAWTAAKVSIVAIGASGAGALIAGGKWGIRGFVWGLVWLVSGLGISFAITQYGPLFVPAGIAFFALSFVTPGLAVRAGLERWRQPA